MNTPPKNWVEVFGRPREKLSLFRTTYWAYPTLFQTCPKILVLYFSLDPTKGLVRFAY